MNKRALFLASAAVHSLILYPTLRRNCAWLGPIVTRFETSRREVWLTIDDGPDPRDTPAILDLLASHQAKATFFVIGKKADAHRDLIWRAYRAGHQIGNHTFSHPSAWFWALGLHATRRQIELGAHSISTAIGRSPEVFRSPVGMTNPFVHRALDTQRLIGWSVSGLDGLSARGDVVVKRIMRKVQPGAIIVLHESGAPGRVETLSMLLKCLSESGYACIIPAADMMR